MANAARMGTNSTSESVKRDLADGVAVVSLNRPHKHNALDDTTSAALAAAIAWATSADDVRSIVIRGEGRSFSSGRDTTQLGQRTRQESDYTFIRRAQQTRLMIIDSPKPVLAVLRGAVLGGALELALSADIRIAADDCALGFPEVGFGIMTDTGGAPLTTVLAGPSRAKYLIMTGERIGGEHALRWGLVDEIVPVAEVDDRAMQLARRLATAPPLSVAMTKEVVDGVWAGAIRAGMRAELLAQSALFRSNDHAEAKEARRDGRPPAFSGR